MGGEVVIWFDLFLRVFVEALGWCAAACVVGGTWIAGWGLGRRDARRAARRGRHFVLPADRSDADYLGREPFGE